MDFFARVKQLVKKSNKPSLQEFIISLGLNHDSYYSLKQAGNLPRADEAIMIAKALGTTVEYLVLGNEEKQLTADEIFEQIQGMIERYQKKHLQTFSKKTRK